MVSVGLTGGRVKRSLGERGKAFLGHHQGNAGPWQPMQLGAGADAAGQVWVRYGF